MEITKLEAGFVTGLWAAIAQAFIGVYPPSFYGICMVSHPRDLEISIINALFSTKFFVHGASVEIPVLTVVGIVIGASVATYHNREFKFRKPKEPMASLFQGFLVAHFGILLGFCSVRAVIGTAYGDIVALSGLASIIIGVILALEYMKWRARRRVSR